MEIVRGVRLTAAASCWLHTTKHGRILHLFPAVCNLVNERGQVLSLTTTAVPLGPFSLIIKQPPGGFRVWLDLSSPVHSDGRRLTVGRLVIAVDAPLWDPRPEWEKVDGRLLRRLAPAGLPPFSTDLPRAVAAGDLATVAGAASKLAGLGIGLTPAGDDFLMGAMLALWACRPAGRAAQFGAAMADAAVPRTTTLSAAYLRAAAQGQASQPWHGLVEALIGGDETAVHRAVETIRAIGHTSGADALAGFVPTVQALTVAAASTTVHV